ncbi:hypothetical protein DY000_02047650 [Brassica cretica]|uniref:DUF4283 domain-containing protein n=1 Tax=Brassica cretica TaxID=69181 RepID=A0ABQ7ENQ8_BRACR|nr:hypothetical protein DY000_02047650 [Brassica cretica]
MGSSYHSKSTHMADIKGKEILYEDDDEPIKLTDHDVSQNINEFKLSLIGKILNPKKQSVEKLLQKMLVQWGMEERITANDLGNGKFLLNFTTEDELNSVLRQGPFHFNFCMFVLVRWEPIVHDDYPWIIPFWTRLIGVPLHLWTENNLREIDIDSRRPLKFARKAESPEGDEVTIEIKYEMLFKHCSTCGMLTHEKEYCPLLQRQGVFARVQLQENRPQQVIRRRDDPSWRKRYGGVRVEAKPYDRYNGASWREKKSQPQSRHDENVVHDRLDEFDPLGERLEQGCRVATVGVDNGYDEVNVQIPAEYKYVFPQQIMLGQENVVTYVPKIKLRSNSIWIKHKPSETYLDQLRIGPSMTIRTRTKRARSLRNYRTCTLSGRYVATERPFRSVAT